MIHDTKYGAEEEASRQVIKKLSGCEQQRLRKMQNEFRKKNLKGKDKGKISWQKCNINKI